MSLSATKLIIVSTRDSLLIAQQKGKMRVKVAKIFPLFQKKIYTRVSTNSDSS